MNFLSQSIPVTQNTTSSSVVQVTGNNGIPTQTHQQASPSAPDTLTSSFTRGHESEEIRDASSYDSAGHAATNAESTFNSPLSTTEPLIPTDVESGANPSLVSNNENSMASPSHVTPQDKSVRSKACENIHPMITRRKDGIFKPKDLSLVWELSFYLLCSARGGGFDTISALIVFFISFSPKLDPRNRNHRTIPHRKRLQPAG
ncbi:hypothetical protein V6N12_048679 [Hibiscus sabdariffa]|uniref:Uncharacterized protein n=1 Tax=Hibiscus sabdariffa TaxID=183260 RepID=A0ABR2EI03_9ROSI